MYLTQFLHRNLQRHAAKTALVCGSATRSYGEMADRVARLAGALKARGVEPGDRIALLSLNSIESIEVWLAAWWIGAVICPVNYRWSEPEIAFSLADCGARTLFVDAEHAALAPALVERVPCVRNVIRLDGDTNASERSCDALISAHRPVDDGRFCGDRLAALLYTGGTTGRAKGVMLSHQNLYAAALSWAVEGGPYENSVALVSTPLFHIAGFGRALVHLVAGATSIVVSQFRASEALDLIERHAITHVTLVPSMLQMLLDDPAFAPERMRTVRRIGYGAAPSARPLLERLAFRLPSVGLYQAYGLSESTAMGTLSSPDDHTPAGWADGRASSAGRAICTMELRVVDAEDRDLPFGTVGEILLRGPTVFSGYWNRPEETAEALRNGWLHTGDGGTLTADGYLHVVDRLKDMIVTGGENVYSAEVENALAQHASVATCSVIGIPSDRWGEAVHAVVVLNAGRTCDAASLIAHCRERLAGYKCPKSIDFVDALPRTAVGKVAKNVLREPYWRGMARRIG